MAAAVAIPLAINPWGQNAFELPKAALLRTLVLLMGLAAIARAVGGAAGAGRPSPRRLSLGPVALAVLSSLVLVLATLFSVDPRAGLWGSYERQQGLLTLLAYPALFLLTAANLRTRRQLERLWIALAWGSGPVIAYGLLQAADLDPLAWQTDAASPVLSTVGRANFFGSYLVLVTPLTAGRAALASRRWPYVLLLAGQITCAALTQARGAWVGLGAAAVTGLLALAAATRDRRPAFAALGLSALAVGFVALLNVRDGPLAPLAHVPGLERLANVSNVEAGSTAARLAIWRTTLALIAARPWLGYGPEAMRSVFAGVFPPQLVYFQGRDVAVDRAHNLWLDLGMNAGLAGVVTFAALLACVGLPIWRGLRNSRERWEQAIWMVLAAAIAGHLAELQFGFELTTSGTTFWLVLAMGAAPATCSLSPPPVRVQVQNEPGKETESPLHLLLPGLLTLALVGQVCARPLLADVAYQRSKVAASPEERLAAATQAVRLWPPEPDYRLELALRALESGDPITTEAELAAAVRLHPDDPGIWAARGRVYALWGETTPARYEQAEEAYRRAVELAPSVSVYHAALGVVLARQGWLEEGIREMERAVALDATDANSYAHLADLYRALGQERKATWAAGEAEKWQDDGQ